MSSQNREYRFADDTCEAFKAKRTVRFLVKVKHKFESRHSKPVIAWAERGIQAICRALIKAVGLEDGQFETQLNTVSLLDSATRTFLCFDIFMEGCDEATRLEISGSTRQPIHFAFKQSHIWYARRDQRLDAKVARQLEEIQEHDKGPKPHFSDLENPPLYIDGLRWEQSEGGNEVYYRESSESAGEGGGEEVS